MITFNQSQVRNPAGPLILVTLSCITHPLRLCAGKIWHLAGHESEAKWYMWQVIYANVIWVENVLRFELKVTLHCRAAETLPLCLFSDHFSIYHLFNDMNMNESHYSNNNQPQQLRCSDRTAVKLGHRKAYSGLLPVDLEPIRAQNIVIRVHAQKVVTNRWVAITLVSYPP